MHAIFLVSAAHLEHLQPGDRTHHIVALQNLSLVLPHFRKAIDTIYDGKECSVDMAEALISCSLLLMQFSWHLDTQVMNGSHGLSGLYRGLMSVTLSCLPRVRGGSLSRMLRYSPRLHIERCMIFSGTKSSINGVFTHILACDKISDIPPEDPEFFSEPLQRLSTIFWALDSAGNGPGEADLELAAARYLFSLPNWLPEGFINKFRLRDGRAQVILLYFFAAIIRLRSERFWWMRKRALSIFEEIARILGDRCVECTGRAQEIFRQKH